MTLVQPTPYLLPAAPEPTQPAPEATPQPQPLGDLISSILKAEDALAIQRNQLLKRISNETLTPAIVQTLANLAKDGAARARNARTRYRRLETALSIHSTYFGNTMRVDWRIAADAALKLALSPAGYQKKPTLHEPLGILTPSELESYAWMRRRARQFTAKPESNQTSAA